MDPRGTTWVAYGMLLAVMMAVGLAAGPQALGMLAGVATLAAVGTLIVAIPARRRNAVARFAAAVGAEPFDGRRVVAAAEEGMGVEPLRELLLMEHPEARRAAKTIVERAAGPGLFPLSGMIARLGDVKLDGIGPHRDVYTDLGGPGIAYRLVAICPPGADESYEEAAERLEQEWKDVAKWMAGVARPLGAGEARLLEAARRRAGPGYTVTGLTYHDPRAVKAAVPLKREAFVAMLTSPELEPVLEWLPLLRPARQARYDAFTTNFQKWGDGMFQLDVFARRPAWPPRAAAPADVWDWYVFEGRLYPAYVELKAAVDEWPDGPLRGRALERPEPSANVVAWDQEFAGVRPYWSVDESGSLLPVALEWRAAAEPSRRVIA